MFKKAITIYEIKPPVPFLLPLNKNKFIYSLVLYLDKTLIYSITEKGKILIRTIF